jgi:uncharacterized protein
MKIGVSLSEQRNKMKMKLTGEWKWTQVHAKYIVNCRRKELARSQSEWKKNSREDENEHECTPRTVLQTLDLNSEIKWKWERKLKRLTVRKTEVAFTENKADEEHRWLPESNRATSDSAHCLSWEKNPRTMPPLTRPSTKA